MAYPSYEAHGQAKFEEYIRPGPMPGVCKHILLSAMMLTQILVSLVGKAGTHSVSGEILNRTKRLSVRRVTIKELIYRVWDYGRSNGGRV